MRLSYGGSAALLRRVFRDPDKTAIATTRLPPDTSGVSFDDRGAIGGPETWYYAVKALSPCSHSEGP